MKDMRKKKITLQNIGITLQDIKITLQNFHEEFVRMDRRLGNVEKEQRKMGLTMEDMQAQLKQARESYVATNKTLDDLADRVDQGFADTDFKLDRIVEMLDQKADKPALLT